MKIHRRIGPLLTRTHGVIPRCFVHSAAAGVLSLIMRTICSGVTGIVFSVTSNGVSAFSIAQMIAAITAIVPHSPTPLTPSGLSGDGDSV